MDTNVLSLIINHIHSLTNITLMLNFGFGKVGFVICAATSTILSAGIDPSILSESYSLMTFSIAALNFSKSSLTTVIVYLTCISFTPLDMFFYSLPKLFMWIFYVFSYFLSRYKPIIRHRPDKWCDN